MAGGAEQWGSDGDDLLLELSSSQLERVAEEAGAAARAPPAKRARRAGWDSPRAEDAIVGVGVEDSTPLPSPVGTPVGAPPEQPGPFSPLRLELDEDAAEGAAAEEPVAEAVGALKVATLNLWATGPREGRARRGLAAAQALLELLPDVVCLQESRRETLRPIWEALGVGKAGEEGARYVSVEPEGEWPWVTKGGNVMLVRSGLALKQARALKYGCGGGKAMLAAKLQLGASHHVWVAATHLSAPDVRGGDWKRRERRSQAREALEALDYLFRKGCAAGAGGAAGPGGGVEEDAAATGGGDGDGEASADGGEATTACAGCILAGDLNWSEQHRAVGAEADGNFAPGDGDILYGLNCDRRQGDSGRADGWLDVWRALHEKKKTGERGFTFDTLRNGMLKDWLGKKGVDGLRLDRVLARLDPAALEPADARLFADYAVEGEFVASHRKDVKDLVPLFVSDHFGLVASFRPPSAAGHSPEKRAASSTQTPSSGASDPHDWIWRRCPEKFTTP